MSVGFRCRKDNSIIIFLFLITSHILCGCSTDSSMLSGLLSGLGTRSNGLSRGQM